MQVQPEIAFRNIRPTGRLRTRIEEGIGSLEEVSERIIACRVMVEEVSPGRRAGKLYHIRIDLTIPGHELVINRTPPEHPSNHDLPQAITEAFDKARRQLLKTQRIRRGQVKTPGLPPHGRVVRLLGTHPGERYGFLQTGEGREVYFHEHAVVGMSYDDLTEGSEVRFAETVGAEGPQASSVTPLDPRRLDRRQASEIPLNPP